MLREARQVDIVTVSEEKPIDPDSLKGLRVFLDGHGIAAAHRDIGCRDRPLGEALQEEAQAHDAGLLVMGAYGHHRLREFVLGGATRAVLAGLRLPTLMSH
jgi:nucleotide-binding universal stress UspA family protein